MLEVLRNSWALLLGMGMLMLGNGLQGSLLGVRGGGAGFSALSMSIVMSAYFAGFLISSRIAPIMIRRVGHVRVFAALASMISAVLILYPSIPHPAVWAIGRLIIGFCFCGVYVTAESWLNNSSSNATRGQALSLYMIVQMVGIILAQQLLLIPDPSGFLLFVIPSVLVSIAFAPILLSVSPTPAFETTKRQSLAELYNVSPLGIVGMFLLGGVFACQFGMASVYGTEAGLSLIQISSFISSFYVGALVMQYPLGWLSDRMDRRQLVTGIALLGGIASLAAAFLGQNYTLLISCAFIIGGCSNPLYSLLIAYTNDFLQPEDMASASAGLLFVNGLGAIMGPVLVGWWMQVYGAQAYFAMIALLLLALTLYALYRMTQRPAPTVEDTSSFPVISAVSTPVAVEFAQEYAIEIAQEEADESQASGS